MFLKRNEEFFLTRCAFRRTTQANTAELNEHGLRKDSIRRLKTKTLSVAHTEAVLAHNLPNLTHLLPFAAEFLERTFVLEQPVRSNKLCDSAICVVGAEEQPRLHLLSLLQAKAFLELLLINAPLLPKNFRAARVRGHVAAETLGLL